MTRAPLMELRAAVSARRCDRALAAGADPASSAVLAIRAARLVAPGRRAELAAVLERLLACVERPERPERSRFRVAPSRPAIAGSARTIDELTVRLRGPAPVYARGVAMLRALVADGTGPVYCDRDGRELAAALRAVAAALEGANPAYSTSVGPWRRSQSLWVR